MFSVASRAAVAAATAVWAAAATLVWTPAAAAAGLGLSITDVQTTPSTVAVGDQLVTDLKFRIATGTPAGQQTQLSLPAALVALPAGFDVRTSDGSLVATAIISSGTPAIITFTTSAYAQTHLDVRGAAFVKDNFDSTVAPPGRTTPLKYVSGSTTFTNELTVSPGGSIDRTGAYKFGQFVRPDQGRTRPDGAIYWFIESPLAPQGGWRSVELKDQIPAGQSLNCATVKVTIGDGSAPGGGFANGAGFADFHFAPPCSATSLDLVTGPVAQGKLVRVQFSTDLSSPTGSAHTSTFTNRATVITTTADGGAMTHPAGSALVQSSAGGNASGMNPVPTTTPPTTTTPTTTTPATSTTPMTPPSSTSTSGTLMTTAPPSRVVVPTSHKPPLSTTATTPVPGSPSPSSSKTTSVGTTIGVLPTSHSIPPTATTTSSSIHSAGGSATSTTSTGPTVLASTGAPVTTAAIAGVLLLLIGSAVLALSARRRRPHRHHPRH